MKNNLEISEMILYLCCNFSELLSYGKFQNIFKLFKRIGAIPVSWLVYFAKVIHPDTVCFMLKEIRVNTPLIEYFAKSDKTKTLSYYFFFKFSIEVPGPG